MSSTESDSSDSSSTDNSDIMIRLENRHKKALVKIMKSEDRGKAEDKILFDIQRFEAT